MAILSSYNSNYEWRSASHGHVPLGAFPAGQDSSGETLFVARAHHEGDCIPGKLVPSHCCAYVAWGGKEHCKTIYEVLCGSPDRLRWLACSDGWVPDEAVLAGKTANGEPLYVGRVFCDGAATLGKVHRSNNLCYVPYAGEERGYLNYEVLESESFECSDMRDHSNSQRPFQTVDFEPSAPSTTITRLSYSPPPRNRKHVLVALILLVLLGSAIIVRISKRISLKSTLSTPKPDRGRAGAGKFAEANAQAGPRGQESLQSLPRPYPYQNPTIRTSRK